MYWIENILLTDIYSGNSNLVYTIIRKRQVFYQLANLSSDSAYIMKMLQGRKGRKSGSVTESKSSIAEGKPLSGKFWYTKFTFLPASLGSFIHKYIKF